MASDQIGRFLGPVLPLVLLSAIAASRRALLLVALFWVPVLATYVLLFPGGLEHYYYRYQHPVLPFIAAFAGGGAAYLIVEAMKRDVVARALLVLGLVIVIVPMYVQFVHWRVTYAAASNAAYDNLEAMGLDLNTFVGPDQTLATHDIGVVGYFADYHVLDLVGLVNDEVIAYHEHRQVGDYLNLRQPQFLLIFDEWDRAYLHLDAADHPERYELVKTYPGGAVHFQTYRLYRVHYE
jgi:hypothetical protein